MSGAPAKATVKSGESPPVQGSEGGSKSRGALWLIGLGLLAALFAYLLQLRLFQSSVHLSAVETDGFSRNVSTCPGYVLSDIQTSPAGLSARLDLAGPPCDAYGYDVKQLVVDVTYETSTRLRVSIADAESRHYRLPAEYFPRPSLTPDSIGTVESELQFHYESSPFAFWITRAEDADVLFDTRLPSLPKAPTRDADGNLLDGFGLVFEDQYLQLTSALPRDANIYGLGEAVASAGLRRATGVGGKSTIQTMWARDEADPVDENMYGVHPVYLDHRIASSGARTHAIFMSTSAGADVVLTTPPSSSPSSPSLIQFRLISGIIDLYIFAGPTPLAAIEQYGALVGTPAWVPYWAFGFHLLRWGYQSVGETRKVVERMREANIPLEVMWNDIDLYHDLRDFTADPVRFPPEDVRTFIRELKSKGQYFIPILDAGIPHIANDTDDYLPFLTGLELDLFIKNPDGSLYIGQVWPGYTVFPDWLHPSVESWWADALRNWTELGVEYSGIWLDMNEPVSFCTGSCGSGADLSNTSQPILFPGDAEDPIVAWPEGYDPTEWGTSGNISVGGKLTFGGADKTGVDFSWGVAEPPHARSYPGEPPYAIHNGHGALAVKSVATNATHIGELTELEVHNLFGYLEERATHRALLANRPSERPFIISRSTFPSSGHWTGHWLGDNHSKWSYLRYNIQGVLQFQIFQIPMVGADICGFNGNTNEELCNRWMSLGAFVPFYRNHNVRGAISQEPYVWDSVAVATRTAMAVRYAMLPYWYTLFADASTNGTPPVRALLWEFPDEGELLSVDLQFLIGANILVSPVTHPNVSYVDAILPGRDKVAWRDWYTHKEVSVAPGATSVRLDAPLGHTPVHIRSGSVLLLHAHPAYTTAATRSGSYELLISLDSADAASGRVYFDDGISPPPTANRTVHFSTVGGGALELRSQGSFMVEQVVERIVVLGVKSRPGKVSVQGDKKGVYTFEEAVGRLNITGLALSLNADVKVRWA